MEKNVTLGTLDQLINCQYRGILLEIYYDEINRLLSLIANESKVDIKYSQPWTVSTISDVYNGMTIDWSIRKFHADVGIFLKNYDTGSYCVTFQNIELMKSIIRHEAPKPSQGSRNLIYTFPPRLPPHTLLRFPIRPQVPNRELQKPQLNIRDKFIHTTTHFNDHQNQWKQIHRFIQDNETTVIDYSFQIRTDFSTTTKNIRHPYQKSA